MLLVAVLMAFAQDLSQPSLPDLLSRVAEEAEILQQNAPKSLTQETLEQRTLMPATRFRPHITVGKKPPSPPQPPRLVVRQIVSEYSVGALKDSAAKNLTEFRQVISVDGRKVQTPERARHTLSLGITAADDRLRKRMLEDFARHGLVDIATDYGILLLAFSKRGLENMKVTFAGDDRIGADSVWVLNWQQISPAGGMLQFVGNEAVHRALAGRLLVRKSDSLPLRIQSWTQPGAETLSDQLKKWSGQPQPGHTIRDEATVDYIRSAHGFLTPASVVHRHLVDGQLITENHYRYETFRMFSADAEIKFTELETPTSAAAPPVKK